MFGTLSILAAVRVDRLLKSFGFLTHQLGQASFLAFVGVYYLGIFDIDWENLSEIQSLLPFLAAIAALGVACVYLYLYVTPHYGGCCGDNLRTPEMIVAVPGTDWLSVNKFKLSMAMRTVSFFVSLFLIAGALAKMFKSECLVIIKDGGTKNVKTQDAKSESKTVDVSWVATPEQVAQLNECEGDARYSCLHCDWSLSRFITGLYCFVFALLVMLSALRWTFFLEDFGFLTRAYGRAGYYILTAFFFCSAGIDWSHLQEFEDAFADWQNLLTLVAGFAIGCVGVVNGLIHLCPCTGGICSDGTEEETRHESSQRNAQPPV